MAWWKGNQRFPCAFNPTTVRIHALNRTGSVSTEVLDEDFQEKTGPYERTSYTIDLKGQPFIERYEKHITIFDGSTKPTTGRVVFKTTEMNKKLAAKGLTELRNGDLIVMLGSQVVEYLIIEVRPVAWMGGGQGMDAEPSLTAAYFNHNFEDRAGSRSPK